MFDLHLFLMLSYEIFETELCWAILGVALNPKVLSGFPLRADVSHQ